MRAARVAISQNQALSKNAFRRFASEAPRRPRQRGPSVGAILGFGVIALSVPIAGYVYQASMHPELIEEEKKARPALGNLLEKIVKPNPPNAPSQSTKSVEIAIIKPEQQESAKKAEDVQKEAPKATPETIEPMQPTKEEEKKVTEVPVVVPEGSAQETAKEEVKSSILSSATLSSLSQLKRMVDSEVNDQEAKTKLGQIVSALETRLEEETKLFWDALNGQTDLEAQRIALLLHNHEVETAQILTRELDIQKTELLKRHESHIQEITQTCQHTLSAEIDKRKTQFEAILALRLDDQARLLETKSKEQLRAQQEEMFRGFNEERMKRISALTEQASLVAAIGGLSVSNWSLKERSKLTHRLHACVDVWERAALSVANRPFVNELETLKALAPSESTGLLSVLLDSVPINCAQSGVCSLRHLQDEFDKVKKEARVAYFTPKVAKNAQPIAALGARLWGLAMATITARQDKVVTKEEAQKQCSQPEGWVFSDVSNENVDSVLARAQFYLHRGELSKTIGEVQKLQGYPAEAAQDWIQKAQERLRVENAIASAKDLAANLSASLS